MREIAQNVPQFGHFGKCSSGSRILRSQFFPGLLKLIAFKGNIWTKSEPVVQLCFNIFLGLYSLKSCLIQTRCPTLYMILNFFRVEFLEKLSNGLIDIHFIFPSKYFFNSEKKKMKILLSAKN
jgi:hypothetical protein